MKCQTFNLKQKINILQSFTYTLNSDILDNSNFQESYHMVRYGPMEKEPLWGKIIIKFSHLLLSLSSAINILIYSYKVGISVTNIQILMIFICQLLLTKWSRIATHSFCNFERWIQREMEMKHFCGINSQKTHILGF